MVVIPLRITWISRSILCLVESTVIMAVASVRRGLNSSIFYTPCKHCRSPCAVLLSKLLAVSTRQSNRCRKMPLTPTSLRMRRCPRSRGSRCTSLGFPSHREFRAPRHLAAKPRPASASTGGRALLNTLLPPPKWPRRAMFDVESAPEVPGDEGCPPENPAAPFLEPIRAAYVNRRCS